MIECSEHCGSALAINLRYTSHREGIEFFTPKIATFQLGYMNRPVGSRYTSSTFLSTEDVVLLMRGGHDFEIMESSEIVEVKQGPFVGARDKRRFEPSQRIAGRPEDEK